MKNGEPVIFAWSGGKDSAYALFQLMKDTRYEVVYLLSTINGNNRRLSMHGVREELIEAQAASLGIPLLKVYVFEGTNREYEERMKDMLLKIKVEGVNKVAFGDIFLEDLRSYRENQLGQIGMDCLFPIWKANTLQLVKNFIGEGFKTYTCCINDGYLDKLWCGRLIDESFIGDLPKGVDPCGENGEFHSFCFDGPIYTKALSVVKGEKVYRPLKISHRDLSATIVTIDTKGFWYCELMLNE
jgi:uncharacterized protein (TIGR00290 family)